jgi:Centromere DNA-binding protein complex CBF3 subunit, domain 2
VESEHVALNVRAQENRCSKDIALRQFLKLLLWLRSVLLQDAAVLYSLYPHSRLFSYRPFNTKPFREFAISSVAIIAHAESEARLAYENMPEHLVASLRGSYAELLMEQRREQEENTRQLQALGEQYTKVEGLLSQLLESAQPTSRKRHKGTFFAFLT